MDWEKESIACEGRPAKTDDKTPPLIGWMILQDYADDLNQWNGVISFPDPTGANLAWQDPIKMIEHSAYDRAAARIAKLEAEIEELMKADYWQDRYNVVVKEHEEDWKRVQDAERERDRYRQALEGAVKTIHHEFCGSDDDHNDLCEQPRRVLEGKNALPNL